MTFKELLSHAGILQAIEEEGYTTPTPIQAAAIPHIVAKKDLFGAAQTGTGKTAAFMLPALQRLTEPSPHHSKGPRILILAPTRELAMQIAGEAEKFSRHLNRIKTVCIFGGAPYPPQNRQLSRPHEILVATPGRLIDHIERGRLDFSRLEMLVLDEADRMLDMGFIDAVERIVSAIPSERQTLLFSATLNNNIRKLSANLLKDPCEVRIDAQNMTLTQIEQRLHHADNLQHKYRLLDRLLEDPELNQVIVFTATKAHADTLSSKLYDKGHRAAALHGDMNQRQRTRTLRQLRENQVNVLIATDVAARGIDIPTISHVINFDLPASTEDYVHRIGRTGRGGNTGIAWSFVCPKDLGWVRQIERFTGKKIACHALQGLEPTVSFNAGAPSGDRRGPPRKKPRFKSYRNSKR